MAAIPSSHAALSFTDLTSWTEFEDPANANFSATATDSRFVLNAANAPIPSGTDIGFASIDGITASTTSSGFVFDPASSFTLAISYTLTLSSATGNIGLGFGIGEEVTGQNTAGIAFQSADTIFGRINGVGGAARINDVSSGENPALAAFIDFDGTMFVTYDADNGNIILGWADALDATDADIINTSFSGATVSNLWNNESLLVSAFMRSDATGGTAWTGGTAEGVFSNLRLLSGSAMTIPEPTSFPLALLGLIFTTRRRRQA